MQFKTKTTQETTHSDDLTISLIINEVVKLHFSEVTLEKWHTLTQCTLLRVKSSFPSPILAANQGNNSTVSEVNKTNRIGNFTFRVDNRYISCVCVRESVYKTSDT